jgi:hypothetical protein
MLEVWEQSRTLLKELGSHDLGIRLTKGLCNGLRASGPKGAEPIYCSILGLRYTHVSKRLLTPT